MSSPCRLSVLEAMDKHHCLACGIVVEGLDLYIHHKRQECPALQLVRSTSNDVSTGTASMHNKEASAKDRHFYETVVSATGSFQDDSHQEKSTSKEASESTSDKAADTGSLSTAVDTHNLPTADHRSPNTRSKTNRPAMYSTEGSPNGDLTTVTETDGQNTGSGERVLSSQSDDNCPACPLLDQESSTTDQSSKLRDEPLNTNIETKPEEDENKEGSTKNQNWCNVCKKTYLSATTFNRHIKSKRHKSLVSQAPSVIDSKEKSSSFHSSGTDDSNGTKISSIDVQSQGSEEHIAKLEASKVMCRQRRKRKLPAGVLPAENSFKQNRNAQRSSTCQTIDLGQNGDSKQQHYCSECPFKTAYKASLRRHLETFHSRYLCGHCNKTFVTSKDCTAHQREVHGTRRRGSGLECSDCDAQFSTEENLNVHRREMRHMLYWGSTCVFCGKTVSKGPCLKGHIQAVHLGEKPHKCQYCSYSTAWATDLRMHVKRHLNIKSFKCPECDYTAVRMVAVKKHLQTHGEGEPRRLCDICGKSFAGNLQRHMTLHKGHKPFECPHNGCTYASTFKQGLTVHVRSVHKADKSIMCEDCGFTTTTEKLMKWHKRRKHSAEKPHKCDQCSYATSWQPHLIRHKRTHTGEKPYNCPHCSYRANNVENLRKHILKTKKHEGLKQYVCKWCPYNTNSQYDFSHHLRNKHPGEDMGIRPTFVLGINRGVAKMKSVRSQDKLGQLAAAPVVELEHDDTMSTGMQGPLPSMMSSQDKLQYQVEETKVISDNHEGGK
ncbi:ZNF407 [Branchiostoma lanceolatum]|uniref:ZNF407 protein n=1 Tax=Branchiostoma lanceolatum TaxID=7740 RepID=A0A8K0F109_BRALA|nr:ZNF407 [Branchiostoma lanceolatum]